MKLALFLSFLLGTTQLLAKDPNYSITRPGNRFIGETGDLYRDKIQPILASRCVSCHSCNSAPCQLNLSSYKGLVRGMSKDNPHSTSLRRSFSEVHRARLEDSFTEEQWRDLGFYPVLPETRDAIKDSIFYLALQNDEEGSPDELEKEDNLSLILDELYVCPVNAKEYKAFRSKYAFAHMPLTCDKIPNQEHKLLMQWLEEGTPGPQKEGLNILTRPTHTSQSQGELALIEKTVRDFEDYLNPPSMRRRAVARYLYEHFYAVNFHFKVNPGEFYRIVRSRTPAPEPIDLIVTEFITDHPGEEYFYYRMQKVDQVIEMKRHIPMEISEDVFREWDSLFFSSDLKWEYSELWNEYPNNPFEWFVAIPVLARARFVEKYAKTMMQVVARGAICHGSDSSYVSPDYAWFLIFKPESDPTVRIPDLGMKYSNGSSYYSEFYSHPRDIANQLVFPPHYPWKAEAYNRNFLSSLDYIHPNGIGLEDISDKEMFYSLRHETSLEFYSMRDTSAPGYTEYKILWSYADYEHFYYRTSVHYKYYGSVAHKFEAFYTVIQRRSLGEYSFALLNPNYELRTQLLNWYTSSKGKKLYRLHKNLLRYDSPDRKSKESNQSFALITQKLLDKFATYQRHENLVHFHTTTHPGLDVELKDKIENEKALEAALRTLTGKRGTFARFVPNIVHVRWKGRTLYTFFVHRGHINDKVIGKEKASLDPAYDQMSVAKGLVGGFTYMFFDINSSNAKDFIENLSRMKSKKDWNAMVNTYGIQRDSAQFYNFLDWMHAWISLHLKDEGGLLDIRYYGT